MLVFVDEFYRIEMPVCCVYSFDFPVQAVLRSRGEARFLHDPVAVMDGLPSRPKVFACNAIARQAGIHEGMSKTKAETFQNVLLKPRVRVAEENAQAALLDCGFSVSPQIESTSPGTVLIGLKGAERLWGGLDRITTQLNDRLCALGFMANVAVAANADSALQAARGFPGITIIPGGQEKKKLAKLSVNVLPAADETLEILHNWGIHTLGTLSRLSKHAVCERLGPSGVRLQQLARGETFRELIPVIPAPTFHEMAELEEGMESLDQVCTLAGNMLGQLMRRLENRALATNRIELEFGLERESDHQLKSDLNTIGASERLRDERKLQLPVATQDAALIFKILQLDLERRPPAGTVKTISMEAIPARVRITQHDFFRTKAPESVKLEWTVLQLQALTGARESQSSAGFSLVQQSHRADDISVLNCSNARVNKKQRQNNEADPKNLPLRRFRPPSPATVTFTNDGRPEGACFNGNKTKVCAAMGPWFRDGDWWQKGRDWCREEWDMELAFHGKTGMYRVSRDLLSDEWFVEGIYD